MMHFVLNSRVTNTRDSIFYNKKWNWIPEKSSQIYKTYKSFIVQVHRKYIVIHKKKLSENLFAIFIARYL